MGRPPSKRKPKRTREEFVEDMRQRQQEKINLIFGLFKQAYVKGLPHKDCIQYVMQETGLRSPSGVTANLIRHPDYHRLEMRSRHVDHSNLVGQQYGNWTVVEYLGYRADRKHWEDPTEPLYTTNYKYAQSYHKFFLVQCSCGSNPTVINMSNLHRAKEAGTSRCRSCAAKERWSRVPRVPAYVKSQLKPRPSRKRGEPEAQEAEDSWVYNLIEQSSRYEDDEEIIFG